jgi:hypothetical protein
MTFQPFENNNMLEDYRTPPLYRGQGLDPLDQGVEHKAGR